MAHTYSNMLFHVIWSTKERYPWISDELKSRLYGYIHRSAEDQGTKIMSMNGMPDHIHALIQAKPSVCISELMRDIKTGSSKWVRTNFPQKNNFCWQDGYGVFSVSESSVPALKAYIENQEQHHKKKSFEDEFKEFLKVHQIAYDERFVVG